ncbi:NAD(P)-binding protein [Wolfiporia cocos MD-104 SS10]|uniref:NAD(P)-binding protein n=1 Tax=Wolfiporia cocos (strain MD-104) TaxID=742152 RepID=A0A2H3J6H6_WOLCO|nr:NAD(P)-binding protein [Wolfiporia cocos MD-104 SS10]
MHLLILGGTGPSGIKLIEEALVASHTIVVYVRSPGKLPEAIASNPSVTVIEGQLTDVEKLTAALEGVHAVLSALGPPTKTGPVYPSNTPLAHAYAVVIDAMEQHGVKRLIALGTASIKDEHDKFSLIFAFLVSGVSIFAHNAYKDIVAVGETIRTRGAEADLDWTIARVPLLTDRESKDVVAGYVGDGRTKTTLSRAAFAAFVVEELEKNQWNRAAPLISSP